MSALLAIPLIGSTWLDAAMPAYPLRVTGFDNVAGQVEFVDTYDHHRNQLPISEWLARMTELQAKPKPAEKPDIPV